MRVQLFFNQSESISFRKTDKLFMNFTKPDQFIKDSVTKEALLPNFAVEVNVPMQMTPRVEAIVEVAASSA